MKVYDAIPTDIKKLATDVYGKGVLRAEYQPTLDNRLTVLTYNQKVYGVAIWHINDVRSMGTISHLIIRPEEINYHAKMVIKSAAREMSKKKIKKIEVVSREPKTSLTLYEYPLLPIMIAAAEREVSQKTWLSPPEILRLGLKRTTRIKNAYSRFKIGEEYQCKNCVNKKYCDCVKVVYAGRIDKILKK